MNQKIVITGGTGTFGTNFLFKSLRENLYDKITIFSRDEYKQHNLRIKLSKEFSHQTINDKVRFFIGDVRDKERLICAFREADYVIHAAALKHVHLCEYNPQEAIKTNIVGTQNVIDAAIENNVKKVICLSTDKCVDPINLYGSTKLCLEKIALNGNFLTKKNNGTIFSVVRYGNVIGSRGSVIPTVVNCQKENLDFTLTDPCMTRFWLTITDAINLCLFGFDKMKGREIFVPILKSFGMGDLVSCLGPDVNVKITGSRPGEKLHECMISKHEIHRAHLFDKYCYVILPEIIDGFIKPADYGDLLQKADINEYTSDVVEKFSNDEFYNIVMEALSKDND